MTKEEFVDLLHKSTAMPKTKVNDFLKAFTKTVEEQLKKGNDITFVGFGKFYVADRKARKGINPRTKKTITIKATKVPKFKAGKKLKDAIKTK